MELPTEGKTYIVRLSSFYATLWEKKYGMKPMMSFAQTGKVFKELSVMFNEYQIAYFLILFFDWAGPDGKDENEANFLATKTHSIFFLRGKIDIMRVYSKNVLGVDTEDLEQVKPLVDRLL